MDALSGLLADPRAREAFVLRVEMDPPWAISVEDEAPLTLIAPVAGHCWLELPDGTQHELRPGDVALVRGPDHYRMADAPGRPTTVVARPHGDCGPVPGAVVVDSTWLGVRTWGTPSAAGTAATDRLLVGTYERTSEVGSRLLSSLPPALVVRAPAADLGVVELLTRESVRDEPGQSVVLDRLLDLALVATIRAHLATAGAEGPGWSRAHTDPPTRHAVGLMHDAPERSWTVASLAAAVGLSRAAFSRRFTELVGVPPMTYLTQWRLTLAADRLADPRVTLDEVARDVGYGSGYALSAAFKRERGISPRDHRRALAG